MTRALLYLVGAGVAYAWALARILPSAAWVIDVAKANPKEPFFLPTFVIAWLGIAWVVAMIVTAIFLCSLRDQDVSAQERRSATRGYR